MKKRIISTMLALCMLLTLLPALSTPANAATNGEYTYYLNEDGEAIISEYTGEEPMLKIPDEFDDHVVVGIDAMVFSGRENLISVKLPSHLRVLGALAFSGCPLLTTITIPQTLNAVTDADWLGGPFSGCVNLKQAILEPGITCVPDGLFRNCIGLTDVSIPDSVTSIGWYSFEGCTTLKSVKLPSKLQSLFASSFAGCIALESIEIPKTLTEVKEGDWLGGPFAGCTSLRKAVLQSGMKEIPAALFRNCEGLEEVSIPNSVTSIGWYAFDGCTNLKTVSLPDKLKSLYASSFRDCTSLQSIRIPKSLNGVGEWDWLGGAFEGCTSLETAVLESGMKAIPDGLFADCEGLQNISIPESVTSIGWGAFRACSSLKELTIPVTVTEIGTQALPDTVTVYGCIGSCADAYAQENEIKFVPLQALAITKQPTDIETAIGETKAVGVQAEGTSLTYQWQYLSWAEFEWADFSSDVEGYQSPELTLSFDESWNDYSIRCIIVDNIGSKVISDPVKVIIIPAILQQPKSIYAKAGTTAAFHVEANGLTLFYQWQYKVPGGSWKNCTDKTDGFEDDTLNVQATAGRNGYQYRCVITNENGKTVTSKAATLTVFSIDTQPTGQSVTGTATATFTVSATGRDLKYQWQYQTPNGDWKNCTSATRGYNTAALTVAGVTDSTNRNGYQYRCKITSGSKTLTSKAAKLTVFAIRTQPSAKSVTGTATAKFTVAATGSNLTYQWQYKTPTGDWKNCTSATKGYNTAALTVAGVTGGTNRDGYQYRCIVTSGNKSLISDAAALTVFAIQTQPSAKTVTGTATAKFTVSATGSNLKYQWQYKTPTGDWKNCTSATKGYNTAALTVAGVTGSTNRNGYQYRCVITSGSSKLISSAAKLTVK